MGESLVFRVFVLYCVYLRTLLGVEGGKIKCEKTIQEREEELVDIDDLDLFPLWFYVLLFLSFIAMAFLGFHEVIESWKGNL